MSESPERTGSAERAASTESTESTESTDPAERAASTASTESTDPAERTGVVEHLGASLADLVEETHGVAPDHPAITEQDRRAPVANAPSGHQPRDLTPAPRPAATPDRTLHMIGNAHLDPVWLWPWQEGYQEARATFASALDRMDEYPDFIFTCDQIVLLSWWRSRIPRCSRASRSA